MKEEEDVVETIQSAEQLLPCLRKFKVFLHCSRVISLLTTLLSKLMFSCFFFFFFFFLKSVPHWEYKPVHLHLLLPSCLWGYMMLKVKYKSTVGIWGQNIDATMYRITSLEIWLLIYWCQIMIFLLKHADNQRIPLTVWLTRDTAKCSWCKLQDSCLLPLKMFNLLNLSALWQRPVCVYFTF